MGTGSREAGGRGGVGVVSGSAHPWLAAGSVVSTRTRPKALACQPRRSWVWGMGSAWTALDSCLAGSPSLGLLCLEQSALTDEMGLKR